MNAGLTMKSSYGKTPLERAVTYKIDRANHASIVACLKKNIAKLPDYYNRVAVKCSLNSLKACGMTKVVSSLPINDLSPPKFVYKLLDEFVNCEMVPLAEDILSYVGTNIGLLTPFEVSFVRDRSLARSQTNQIAQLKSDGSQVLEEVGILQARIRKLEDDLADERARRERDHKAIMTTLLAMTNGQGAPRRQRERGGEGEGEGEGEGGGTEVKRKRL